MTAAVVLLGLGLSAGAAGLLWIDDDGDGGPVDVVTASPSDGRVSFESLSPFEAKSKGRLEEARRKIKRLTEVGERQGNVIKVMDDDGTPVYFLDHLVQGKGRFGEPIYAEVQVKPMPMGVSREVRTVNMPEHRLPKLAKKTDKKINFGHIGNKGQKKKDDDDAGGPTSTDVDDG